MQTIGTLDDVPLIVMDVDVATSATQRSVVFQDARQRGSCSVELHVTGVTGTVNLTLRPLGQNSVPAADPTRLLALNLDVPNLSALTADFHDVFLLPMYTAYFQLEVQSNSGALVHVQAIVRGANASFDDAAAGGGAAPASHVVVDSLPATPAGSNTIGTVLAILQAGANAIGKLAANAGINIGTVDVASLPSLVLAAGTAAIGKLAANAGVNIGTVDVASLPALPAGTNAIGAVTVALPTTPLDQSGTVSTTAAVVGTSQGTLKFGFQVTNGHTAATLYGGGPNVSTTRYQVKILAGQTSNLIPISDWANFYLVSDTASTPYAYGGQ